MTAKKQDWKARSSALALQVVELEKELTREQNARIALQKNMEEKYSRIAVLTEEITALKVRNNETVDRNLRAQETIREMKAEMAVDKENIARLQGYVDRVLEDDSVREVGVVTEKGESSTARRGPPPIMRVVGAFDEVARRHDGVSVSRRETPWYNR